MSDSKRKHNLNKKKKIAHQKPHKTITFIWTQIKYDDFFTQKKEFFFTMKKFRQHNEKLSFFFFLFGGKNTKHKRYLKQNPNKPSR